MPRAVFMSSWSDLIHRGSISAFDDGWRTRLPAHGGGTGVSWTFLKLVAFWDRHATVAGGRMGVDPRSPRPTAGPRRWGVAPLRGWHTKAREAVT